MKQLLDAMLSALEQGQAVVLCTVLSASGSAPRGAGAKMTVFEDGSTAGTVGGGAVELESARQAARVLQSRQPALKEYRLAPNPEQDLGMICGGSVTVLFQCFLPQSGEALALLRAAKAAQEAHREAWLVLRVHDGGAGIYDRAQGLRFLRELPPEQLEGRLQGRPVYAPGEGLYTEPLTQAGCAYIFGGGHVGAALVPVLAGVGFRVTVFDNRPDFARPERYPAAERVILGDYLHISEKITITQNDYAAIMTPGHQADREVLFQVLQTPAYYIGCIGSRGKVAKTREYLLERGVSEENLARVHAPIGLELYGQTPEEIAISICAEMIRCRAIRAGLNKLHARTPQPRREEGSK